MTLSRIKILVLGLIGVLGIAGAATSAPAEAQSGPDGDDTVVVVMTEMEPFVVNDDGEPDGFYAEVWDEVAAELGIDYEVLWVDSFGDVLPAIADGRAEVAVAPLAPTAEREALFDFSSAVVASGPQLGVSDRLDTRPSLIRSMFDVRVITLFAVAVAGLLVLAHIIWFFERNRHHDDGDFDARYLHGIWDGLWWSTVTTTTVGYGDKAPKSFGGRLIALVAMLSSLVLVGAFVSQVTSIMAEDLDDDAVTSLADVDGPIGVVGGSSFAEYLVDEGALTVEFDSQTDLFAAVENETVDVIVTNPFALEASGDQLGLRPAGDVLYEEFETFGLAQGSVWREPINQALANLQASGEIAEMVKDGLN